MVRRAKEDILLYNLMFRSGRKLSIGIEIVLIEADRSGIVSLRS